MAPKRKQQKGKYYTWDEVWNPTTGKLRHLLQSRDSTDPYDTSKWVFKDEYSHLYKGGAFGSSPWVPESPDHGLNISNGDYDTWFESIKADNRTSLNSRRLAGTAYLDEDAINMLQIKNSEIMSALQSHSQLSKTGLANVGKPEHTQTDRTRTTLNIRGKKYDTHKLIAMANQREVWSRKFVQGKEDIDMTGRHLSIRKEIMEPWSFIGGFTGENTADRALENTEAKQAYQNEIAESSGASAMTPEDISELGRFIREKIEIGEGLSPETASRTIGPKEKRGWLNIHNAGADLLETIYGAMNSTFIGGTVPALSKATIAPMFGTNASEAPTFNHITVESIKDKKPKVKVSNQPAHQSAIDNLITGGKAPIDYITKLNQKSYLPFRVNVNRLESKVDPLFNFEGSIYATPDTLPTLMWHWRDHFNRMNTSAPIAPPAITSPPSPVSSPIEEEVIDDISPAPAEKSTFEDIASAIQSANPSQPPRSVIMSSDETAKSMSSVQSTGRDLTKRDLERIRRATVESSSTSGVQILPTREIGRLMGNVSYFTRKSGYAT